MSKYFLSFITGLTLITLLSACAPTFAPGVGLNLAPVSPKFDSLPAQNPPAPAQQTTAGTQPSMRTLNVTGVGTVYLTDRKSVV